MKQVSPFLQSLPALRGFLKDNSAEVEEIIHRARNSNPWFIPEFSKLAIDAITDEFLDQQKVKDWIAAYPVGDKKLNIAIVMAGNLPLVGFHDLLCVLAAGHKALIKCSEKDSVLLPWLTQQWTRIAPELGSSIQYVDRFEGHDAVIATGSNNSSRYFEYYFRSHPHILRKNRNGVAVLTGEESLDELKLLGNDIFQYFGMGCRSVSKLYVPEGYDFELFEEAIVGWKHLEDHHKYKNNLEYNFAIFIINQVPHIQLDHLILKDDESIASRIGCLHYSYYKDVASLEQMLNQKKDEIQCVVSGIPLNNWDHVHFGESQHPHLNQYADGVDTMTFLTSL
ncbi:MAG TPA: acyl-CoA reductase [Saprospiraceae bacterium]